MMKKKDLLCFLLILLLINNKLFSQSKNQIAQSEYMSAEDAYSEGNYDKCLEHLNKAEEQAGNNRLIQYLRVKSFYSKNNLREAEKELGIFFEITPETFSNEPQYKEMVSLISPLRTKNELLGKKIDESISFLIKAKYNISYGKTTEANANILEFSKYYTSNLKNDINWGDFFKLASSEINKLKKFKDIPNILFDERQFTFYKTCNIGNQTWMAENMSEMMMNLPNTSGYGLGDSNENYKKYGGLLDHSSAKNICPEGWRLPSSKDWEKLFSYLIQEPFDSDFKKSTKLPQSNLYNLLQKHGFNIELKSGYYDLKDKEYVIEKPFFWNAKTVFWASDASIEITDYVEKSNSIYDWLKGKATVFVNSYSDYSSGRYYCRCIKEGTNSVVSTNNYNQSVLLNDDKSTNENNYSKKNEVSNNTSNSLNSEFLYKPAPKDATFDEKKGQARDYLINARKAIESGNTYLANRFLVYFGIFFNNELSNQITLEQLGSVCKEELLAIKSAKINPNTFLDKRTLFFYQTIKIGENTWFAQDLIYNIGASENKNIDVESEQWPSFLYNWKAANSACPEGWHLPAKQDWEELIIALGGEKTASEMLKSSYGWKNGENGSNASGFNAIPVGAMLADGDFVENRESAIYWSSEINNSGYPYRFKLSYENSNIDWAYKAKDNAYPCRCVKD